MESCQSLCRSQSLACKEELPVLQVKKNHSIQKWLILHWGSNPISGLQLGLQLKQVDRINQSNRYVTTSRIPIPSLLTCCRIFG